MKRFAALIVFGVLATSLSWATVTTTDLTVSFTCTGSTGPFPFTFPISAPAALTVTQNGTVLSSTAYTMIPVNNNYENGGSVTLNSSCPASQPLVLTRISPVNQTTVFADNMPIPMKTFEYSLDKLTEIEQEQSDSLHGLWGLPIYEPTAPSGTCFPPNQVEYVTATVPYAQYTCVPGTPPALPQWVATGTSTSPGTGCAGGNAIATGCTGATTAAGAYANIVAPNSSKSVTQDPFDASPNLSDNAAALNAAFAYAQANNVCLSFPDGIFQTKSELTWNSGSTLCLKGDGLGKSFIYYTGTSTVDSALLVHNSSGFAQMDLTDIGFLANQNASYALHGEEIGGASSMDGVMANGGSVSAFEGDGFNFEGDVRNLNIGQSVNLATGLSLPCANGATFAEYVPAGIPSGQFSLTMPNIEACNGIGLNMTDSSAVPVNGGQISSNHQQLYMNCTVGCNANGSTFNQVLIEDCTSGVLCPDGVNSVASRIDGDGNVFIGVNFGFANALQVYGNKNQFSGRSEMWVAVESGATGNIFVNDELLSSSTNAGTNTTGYGNLDQTDARASLFDILNVDNANLADNIGGTPFFVNGATSGGGLMAQFNPANATLGNYGIQITGEGSGDNDVYIQLNDMIWAGSTESGQMSLKTGPGGTTWALFNNSGESLKSGFTYQINGVPIGTANLADWTDSGAVTNYVATCITVVSSNCTAWAPRAGGSGSAFSGGLGASYQDVTEIAAPSDPASGNDRLYTNSTTHLLACLTSGGGNCMPTGGGSGTVSSVALTVPSWLTVGGSPITTSGTLAVSPTTAQTSHQVIGTCGTATTFGPCALVAGDIPTAIPIANIGSAGLSGTSPIAIASSGAISIQVANTSQNGYLASADWNTFNGKQNALSLIAGTYTNGDWCSYASSGTLLNCNNAVPQVNLSLIKGTYTNTDLCTYTTSGTLLNCNTATSTFQAALSLLAGTYVDGDLCSYTASGTLLNCNTAPGGTGNMSDGSGTTTVGDFPETTSTSHVYSLNTPATVLSQIGAAPALGNNVPQTTSFTIVVNTVHRFTGSGASNATTPASVTTGFIASIWNQGTAAVTVVTGGPTLICVPSTCIVPIGAAASITTDGTNFDVQISNALGSAFGTMSTQNAGSVAITGGSVVATTLGTATNCSSSASPAVCGSAAAGSVALPTNAVSSSIVVNTTAVTAISQIGMWADDTLGTKLGVTCNSTVATLVGGLAISNRVPGTSFTISNNVAVVTNPLCVSYMVIN